MNSKKHFPGKLTARYTELVVYGILFLVLVAAVFVININLANRSRGETEQVFCATRQQEYWQTSYRNLLKTQTGLIELGGMLEVLSLSSPEFAEKIKAGQRTRNINAILAQISAQDSLTQQQLIAISRKTGEISESFQGYRHTITAFDSTVSVLRHGGTLSIDGSRYEIEKVADERAGRYMESIEKTWLSSRTEIFKVIAPAYTSRPFPDENMLDKAIDFAITKDESIQANNRNFIVSLGEIATERGGNLLSIQIGALVLSFIVFIAMALRLTVSLRHQEKLIRDSQSQLIQSEKMASLGQMMAGLAHEMNTPLGFVRSNVEIIEENEREFHSALTKARTVLKLLVGGDYDRIEAETQKALSKINEIDKHGLVDENMMMVTNSLEGLDRIQNLIVNLRNFSRLDQTARQHANVNECLESTLVIANHLIKRHMTVKKEYADLPSVMCAPAQLNQVFLNIISNAAHATEEQGQGTLLLKTWIEQENIVIQISDDGKGIPPEQIDKIFDPFFTTKPVGKGTGLGLAISRKIIEDGHGGSLVVKSAVNKGTHFFIRLPIRDDQNMQTEQLFQTTDITLS